MMKKVIIYGCFPMLIACSGSGNEGDGVQGGETEAIEMLASVFSGFFTKEEIKAKLDSAMVMHNIPLTKENYLQLGNQLTSLRKESKKGIREMDILNNMLRVEDVKDGLSITERASHSARNLEDRHNL